ncbi:MAG: dTMP kinase [Bacteroidetes bacterium GWB2_41_8]|nr:MAG: dTMP kinase [Bacteroidetes bacterium GWB2_41_8]
MKSLFIVFEGIDGSGKSTQINLLKQKFENRGLGVLIESEPTNNPVGEMIQDVMTGKITLANESIAALFLADRLEHITNPINGLNEKLANGNNIIASRYYFSSYAFQSDAVPLKWLVESNELCKSLLKADLTFYLNIDPEQSYERVKKRGKQLELFETREKLIKTHNQYLKAFDLYGHDENIFIINAGNSIQKIHSDIWSIVKSKLNLE